MRIYCILCLCVLAFASEVTAFDYPEYVATKQDYINLLSLPETKDRAARELKALTEVRDATAIRVISGSQETKDLVTEEIPNPMPLYKRKRFKSIDEVQELIDEKVDATLEAK